MIASVYKQQPYRKVGLLSVWLVVLAGAGSLCLWWAPTTQILSVQSGSMQPLIHKGDAVVIEPVRSDNLQVGDIISYHTPADDRVVITHRIQSINTLAGTVTTKGDNAPRADQPTPIDLVIGRLQHRLPGLGYGIDMVHSTVGLIAVIYIPAFVVVVLELRRLTLFFQPTYVLRN